MKKTTTPKQSLTKAKILKGIKMLINHNTVLPILESVYLADNFISMTDLENHVTIPFTMKGLNGECCIYADKFISAVEMIEEIKFNFIPIKKRTENSSENGNLEMISENRKVKVVSEDPNNFPRSPIENSEAKDFNEIGFFGEKEIEAFKNALSFVSNDDLRPAMTGVFVKDNIVATDAHRMYWKKIIALPDGSEMIMPVKTVKLMLHFGGNWQVFGGRLEVHEKEKRTQYQQVALLNEDGVLIQFRTIDARFPDYKVVIPTGKPAATLISDTSLWRKELKYALKFANVSTHMGIVTLNGKVLLHSNDIDFSHEYTREFKPSEVETKGEKIQIAFNMHLLDDVLAILPNDEPLKINMWAATKAVIINDHCLLMPLMLNQ